ncbi:succinate dehydrogenase assembly factor 2 [Aggregatibacter actinomycetemcomitans]|uniref:FAD assembly factor SdhE n=1 Tax=Aggregatibacter actinomycetemcomitans TaxID=714 RepID=UPI001E4817F6|nr:succinate dehydrogenase assembly factor 2 [Aggregatibacter actinomycetemcomitans]
MKDYDPFRIEWDCRRGMLELDKVIMPFYQQHFAQLSEHQKAVFVRLLACSDLQLFSWFFNNGTIDDPELCKMVAKIQQKLNLTN